MFVNFPINPGVFTDDTELSAKGYFVDADKVRFERGKPQTIGGWEIATNNLVTGICRGLFTWKNSIAQAWAELGTHVGTWAYFDGVLYENTPIIERGELTNPFDTTDTDETVTVNDTAHGLVVDQRVYFANASAVGGITPDGWYPVATVPDANIRKELEYINRLEINVAYPFLLQVFEDAENGLLSKEDLIKILKFLIDLHQVLHNC